MSGAYRRRSPLELLCGSLYVDLDRDPRNTVFLAGSGRSGTTWLSGVINQDDEYRYVFEPFHPGKVALCKNFRRKQYLRPDDVREEFLKPARVILSGGLRNRWTDRFNRRIVARKRLVKDIRANLLLGWMRARFPGMPIVLLLRHPCAVAASKLALGWKDNLTDILEQEELVEDFLLPVEAELRSAKTAFERHIFVWCVENYVPLLQLAPDEVHLVFYEGLVSRPEQELRRLFSYLYTEPDESTPRRPRRGSGRPVGGWTRSVNAAQRKKAVQILGLFGLDRVYGDDPMPDPAGARSLMGAKGALGGT